MGKALQWPVSHPSGQAAWIQNRNGCDDDTKRMGYEHQATIKGSRGPPVGERSQERKRLPGRPVLVAELLICSLSLNESAS